ncbi:MAG: hypothetical protein LBS55_14340 [Prevotellaceae bacterium]|jgi:hypothetical protein|nr:hypothetical protein [Prevotellaceae bacterium]
MKKIFIGGIATIVIAAAIALNVNISAKNNDLSDIVLANTEALAGFEFNNQSWDDYYHWYNNVGSSWKPYQHECTGSSSGGIQICLAYNAINVCIQWGYENSWSGQMVSCQLGFGDCVNGTNCIPN